MSSLPSDGIRDSGFGIRNSEFLVWQLADSAFPTGGFAHSAGLEAAWQHGEVQNRAELISFAEASLHQIGRSSLPFVAAAHTQPDRVDELDRLCEAFTTNHVANRASRLQGKAFHAAVDRIFSAGQTSSLPTANASPSTMRRAEADRKPALHHTHFAPVFGALTRKLGLPRETVVRLFLFMHLRGILAAAVRLNIVGPMDAQAIQLRLAPRLEEILERCERLTLDDLAQTSPLLDLWQGGQDRLYSRLFQS